MMASTVTPSPVLLAGSLTRVERHAVSVWNIKLRGRGPLSKFSRNNERRMDVLLALNDTSARGFSGQETKLPVQDVVIVGGGIAGLSVALGLHRLGIKPLLFEQSDHLRIEGSSISLWSNAWRALEALGVADGLRNKFLKLSGAEFIRKDGSLIRSFEFDEGSGDIELRGVERKALIESLRGSLPDGVVLYDSQVNAIKKLNGGYTEVQCRSGLTVQTKVLIGCDGGASFVAKWMNMGELRFVGQTAIRGLAVYPDGYNLSLRAKQILGQGMRAGLVPMDATRVYWFVVFNSTAEKLKDVELIREEALNFAREFPAVMMEAVQRSPLDTFSRRALSDRWMWPSAWKPFYKDGVTLAGDAMHPMTPNLGQGGCCALEDAVVLARKLSKALSPAQHSDHDLRMPSQEKQQIEQALKSYTEERRSRMFPMAVRSYFTGAFMQVDSEIVCSIRNKLIGRLPSADRLFDHTFFDCGSLY